jgi:hypothetical protein
MVSIKSIKGDFFKGTKEVSHQLAETLIKKGIAELTEKAKTKTKQK